MYAAALEIEIAKDSWLFINVVMGSGTSEIYDLRLLNPEVHVGKLLKAVSFWERHHHYQIWWMVSMLGCIICMDSHRIIWVYAAQMHKFIRLLISSFKKTHKPIFTYTGILS